MPDWLVWIQYISWFYYGNEALTINQWKDVGEDEITCDNGELMVLFLRTDCRTLPDSLLRFPDADVQLHRALPGPGPGPG